MLARNTNGKNFNLERDVLKIFDDEIKPKCLKLIKMSKKIDLDPRGKMF